MRFYIGLTVALAGPMLALLAIWYILRHGFTGYLVVFAGLTCFGLLIDQDRRRRRQAVELEETRQVPVSLAGLAATARAASPQLVQAIGLDLAGTAGAMGVFVAIAVLAGWASHLNFTPRSVIAGSPAQPLAASGLTLPGGIAVSRSGSMYLTDELNLRVDRFSRAGKLMTGWAHGGRVGGFRWPVRLAIGPQHRLYVADAQAGAIDVFSGSGVRLASWRMPDAFDAPMGMAFDRHGNLYVALLAADRIEKFSPRGKLLASWGRFGDGPGQFDEPAGIAIGPSGDIYVLDTLNNRVQTFTSSFRHLASWGRTQDDAPGDFSHPAGIAIDAAGNVYVADTDNHRIEKFSSAGRLLAVWGRYGHGPDQFDSPHGIAIDKHGNVYVADTYNHRIVKLDSSGHVVATYQPKVAPPDVSPEHAVGAGISGKRVTTRHNSPLLAWFHVFAP